jgi:hypothetical protein
VCVLDDYERRHHQHPLEERRHRRLELVAAPLGVERVDVGSRRDLGVEGDREQRQPRRKVGHHRRHEGRDLCACLFP